MAGPRKHPKRSQSDICETVEPEDEELFSTHVPTIIRDLVLPPDPASIATEVADIERLPRRNGADAFGETHGSADDFHHDVTSTPTWIDEETPRADRVRDAAKSAPVDGGWKPIFGEEEDEVTENALLERRRRLTSSPFLERTTFEGVLPLPTEREEKHSKQAVVETSRVSTTTYSEVAGDRASDALSAPTGARMLRGLLLFAVAIFVGALLVYATGR